MCVWGGHKFSGVLLNKILIEVLYVFAVCSTYWILKIFADHLLRHVVLLVLHLRVSH